MKILSIGNSFSQDALRYLHGLARSKGIDVKSVNLYIGGCSLRMHCDNITKDLKNYDFELNGNSSGIKVSLREALESDKWDFITLQQVSQESPDYSTYQPYLNELAAYVGKYSPDSKPVIHQTWAYEDGSERLYNIAGYKKASDMFADIEDSYKKAADDIGAYGIIPCGKVFMRAIDNGISRMHRDTFHASLGVGRYALALTWYAFFTGNDIESVNFSDFDVPVTETEISIIKKTVGQILG